MGQKFVNNLTLQTSADISDSTSSIPVVSTAGLPTLGIGDWMYVTLTDIREGGELRWEVVKLNNYSSNTLSVIRGQDGTTGQAWLAGSSVSNRVTAGDMQELENFKDASRSIALTGDVVGTVSYTGTGTVSIGTTVSKLTISDMNNPITGPDSTTQNAIGYVNSLSLLGQTDGALYAQAYSSALQHQIYGDYRTGSILVRGKNNGTWTTWNKVWHSGNGGSGSGLDADLLDGNDSTYYASVASPALTGTPTAPTAVPGTNTTQLATTEFVATAATKKVDKDSDTGAALLPSGTSAQRPTGKQALFRFNTDIYRFEGHNGTAWGSLGGATGGGNDAVFYVNGQTVTANYTIPSGQNAMSAGPITIADGVTVTISDGSVWTVV